MGVIVDTAVISKCEREDGHFLRASVQRQTLAETPQAKGQTAAGLVSAILTIRVAIPDSSGLARTRRRCLRASRYRRTR
jgi:hypothetical protein